jgi:hypothetical protein
MVDACTYHVDELVVVDEAQAAGVHEVHDAVQIPGLEGAVAALQHRLLPTRRWERKRGKTHTVCGEGGSAVRREGESQSSKTPTHTVAIFTLKSSRSNLPTLDRSCLDRFSKYSRISQNPSEPRERMNSRIC